ncbi:MAG TPA: hypothetical protein VN676_01855 [Steroidobacteraceae bacterium]|nr:hypothetical protein [Steroidobacteraceae bacterium]
MAQIQDALDGTAQQLHYRVADRLREGDQLPHQFTAAAKGAAGESTPQILAEGREIRQQTRLSLIAVGRL